MKIELNVGRPPPPGIEDLLVGEEEEPIHVYGDQKCQKQTVLCERGSSVKVRETHRKKDIKGGKLIFFFLLGTCQNNNIHLILEASSRKHFTFRPVSDILTKFYSQLVKTVQLSELSSKPF